jgi:hypothetical protein
MSMNQDRSMLLKLIEEQWTVAWDTTFGQLLENLAGTKFKHISKEQFKTINNSEWIDLLSHYTGNAAGNLIWDPKREPQRIPVMLGAIRQLWNIQDVKTLGQLVFDAVDKKAIRSSLYSLSDDDLILMINKQLVA